MLLVVVAAAMDIKWIGISNKKFIDFKLLLPSFLKIPLV